MAPLAVMLYTSAPDVATRAPEHYPAHAERLAAFRARGELLLVGTIGDPQSQGSMGIFTDRAAAEAFASGDPFVLHGVVAAWEVRDWNEIYGLPGGGA
jgi:uncharacterized protein YciI